MKSCAILKATILILMAGSTYAAIQGATIPLSPAPSPSPDSFHVNLTHLLSVAGPYHKFLSFLLSTEVIDILQNQANDTEQGVTIFVPSDDAFNNLKKSSISNLTVDQLKSLLLFHAMPKFYTFADFRNLSQLSPVATFAGGAYTLNFTDDSGTIHIYSGWSSAKISSAVLSTFPASVYAVDHVLLPEAIFGPAPPPAPVPVPAPGTNTSDVTPPSQSPPSPPGDAVSGSPESSTDSTPSSAAPSSRPLFAGALFLSLLAVNGACVLL